MQPPGHLPASSETTILPQNSHITLDELFCACSIFNIHRGVLGTTVYSESGYLQDMRGCSNSIRIRYVWTRFFKNTQQKISRFKNIRIRMDGALDKFHQPYINLAVTYNVSSCLAIHPDTEGVSERTIRTLSPPRGGGGQVLLGMCCWPLRTPTPL